MVNKARIAVLFDANLDDRKGMTNAIISRITNLNKYLSQDIKCDIICISYYRFYRKKKNRPKFQIIDGLDIKIKWRKLSIIDYLLDYKMHLPPILGPIRNRLMARILKDYDMIAAHSFLGADIAYKTFIHYDVPYCVTWHGSDIHTNPFLSCYKLKRTKAIIENAKTNFFVSRALLNKSEEITKCGYNELLYNGVNPIFHTFDNDTKHKLRQQYQVSDSIKIIAFVGGLIPIKNAFLLPDIFAQIYQENPNVFFWIIGDGKLKAVIEERCQEIGLSDKVNLFGNVPYAEMPYLMNCIDLLVLPSVNEGLPLVTIEALRCGAKVIGSDVGGIPEAIGRDNVVSLGDNFIQRFAERCNAALNGNYVINNNKELDWERTAAKEASIYNFILKLS